MKKLTLIIAILLSASLQAQKYYSSEEYYEKEKTGRVVIITLTDSLVTLQFIEGVNTSNLTYRIDKVRKNRFKATYFSPENLCHFEMKGNTIKIYVMDRNRMYHVDVEFLNLIELL